MFQVASHPAHFAHHPAPRRASHVPAQAPSVQLPRTLARPPFAEVAPAALAAAAPDLASTPPAYVRADLRTKAPQLLAGLAALTPGHVPPSVPRERLPKALAVPLRGPAQFLPTHILAVAAARAGPDAPLTLVPAHALVLAAHCAHLPPLPPPAAPAHAHTLTLPLVPLSVPAPAAFPLLHAFLVARALPALLGGLLPLPAPFLRTLAPPTLAAALASGQTLHQLSAHLAAHAAGDLQALTAHAARVRDLWQDAAALGVHDPELWDALDLAWEAVLGALALAQQAQANA